jgi:hypothetical protein
MVTIDLWTVYENPSDFPGLFVARPFNGEEATDVHIAAPKLETIRGMMEMMGMSCLSRHEKDDPTIVETWF